MQVESFMPPHFCPSQLDVLAFHVVVVLVVIVFGILVGKIVCDQAQAEPAPPGLLTHLLDLLAVSGEDVLRWIPHGAGDDLDAVLIDE
eukprot:scaffold3356_cov264-Pinguiococcus_pyrenoidosus.AAC.15